MTRLVVLLAVLAALIGCEQGSSRPVLYVFTADGCRQCELDKPTINKLRSRVTIKVFDAERNAADFRRYGVRATPTYVVVVDGEKRIATHSIRSAIKKLK